MPLSPTDREAYQKFLTTGGELHLTVSKDDIAKNREFEKSPGFAWKLRNGFELPPSLIVYETEIAAQILVDGDDWARIPVTIYNLGGRIIYRELSPDLYAVKLELPPMNHTA